MFLIVFANLIWHYHKFNSTKKSFKKMTYNFITLKLMVRAILICLTILHCIHCGLMTWELTWSRVGEYDMAYIPKVSPIPDFTNC